MFACCYEAAPEHAQTVQLLDPCAEDQMAVACVTQKAALSDTMPHATSSKEEPAPEEEPGSKAQPVVESKMFDVWLTKATADEPWGLGLELVAKSGVWISSVSEDTGVVARYNKCAREDKRICSGDVILEVNGERQTVKMARIMRQPVDLALLVKRPREFDQTLALNGKPLGLEFHHQENGTGLYIKTIASDSPILSGGADLHVGDRIVAVNGRRGASQDLLEALSSDAALVITVARL